MTNVGRQQVFEKNLNLLRIDRIILVNWGPTMGDREYLYELALILDSAEGTQRHDEPFFIRIEAMTAKDIASRLRQIANRMANMVH